MKDSRRKFRYISLKTGKLKGYYSFSRSTYDNGNTKYLIVDTDLNKVIKEVTVDIPDHLDEFKLAVDTDDNMDILLKSLGIIPSEPYESNKDEGYAIYNYNKMEIKHYSADLSTSDKRLKLYSGCGGDKQWEKDQKNNKVIQLPTKRGQLLQMQSK